MSDLTTIIFDSQTANLIVAAEVLQVAKMGLEDLWSGRVERWLKVWNASKARTDMQAQIDIIAASGNLSFLLAIAAAETAIISTYRTDLFAQAVMEASGALQPSGQPYRKFVSPGWYYTTTSDLVTHPSGMVFSAPVNWSS